MADFRARQRVQIHDGTDEFLVLQTKPGFIAISDGTEVANVNVSNQLEVSVENTVTVTATDLDIRNLSEATDQVLSFANTVKDGTGTDLVPLVDADGHFQVDVLTGGGGTEYSEDAATPATILGSATLVERDDVLSAVTPVEGDWIGLRGSANGALWVTVDQDVNVTATDLDIRDLTSASDSVEVLQNTHGDLNANVTLQINDVDVSASVPVPVSATAAANSAANPIYVQVVSTGLSSNEVHDFDTTASVAKDANSNHDYTVTGTTFLLKKVTVSASGAQKIIIQTGPVASLVTVKTVFTSAANPSLEVTFDPPKEVPVTGTGTVRLIRRNDDNSSMDVYSTIEGNDVA